MEVTTRIPPVRLAGVGLTIAVAVWLAVCYAWKETRNWTPLYDVPIALDKPPVQIPEFEVDVEGSYGIGVVPFQQYDYSDRPEKWQWSVTSRGRIIAQGSEVPGFNGYLGTFFARQGSYVLNLAPGKGAPPSGRVWVREIGVAYAAAELRVNRAFQLLLVIVTAHIYLLLRAAVERRRDRQEEEQRAWPLTQPGALGPAPRIDSTIRRPWKLRQSPRPAFARLSWFGLLTSIVCLFAMLASFLSYMFVFPAPIGLPVRLLRPGVQGQRLAGLEPLVVRVACSGGGPSPNSSIPSGLMTAEQLPPCASPILYFNSERVAWDQLGPLLDKKLLLRPPVWPVYVQGEGRLEWRSVARAVDIVEGKGAQVVLLTDWAAASREPVR